MGRSSPPTSPRVPVAGSRQRFFPRHADHEARRKAAPGTLAKYRGRFEAVTTKRDELYDRACTRTPY